MGHEIAERNPLAAARTGRSVMADDPDQDLVARWHQGEQSAFEALVRRHERRVFRLLLRMLGNRADAEDVAQETFLNLHRHGHRFRHESRFSTFLYRIAANAALNRRRSAARGRAREVILAHSAGTPVEASPRSADPEREFGRSEVRGRVQAALLELTPTLRLPLVMYDIEGLSYGEIARVLEIAEGTVKSRIHRARFALRDRLGSLAREEMTTLESGRMKP